MLSATGHRVLPIESAELEQLVSTGLTIATALVSWWKNNSFTPEAIEADDFLCQLKEHKYPKRDDAATASSLFDYLLLF